MWSPYSARTTGFPFRQTSANVDWSAVVAPFWADISTRGNQSERIYYKNFTKGEERRATADIRKLIASTIPQLRGFTPEWTLIITWDRVGYYPNHDDKVMRGRLLFLYHAYGSLSQRPCVICISHMCKHSIHLIC